MERAKHAVRRCMGKTSFSLCLSIEITIVRLKFSPTPTSHEQKQAALESPKEITRTQALALASTNLEKLLGLNVEPELSDLVATEYGDLLDFGSKVVGVIAPRKGAVDLF